MILLILFMAANGLHSYWRNCWLCFCWFGHVFHSKWRAQQAQITPVDPPWVNSYLTHQMKGPTLGPCQPLHSWISKIHFTLGPICLPVCWDPLGRYWLDLDQVVAAMFPTLNSIQRRKIDEVYGEHCIGWVRYCLELTKLALYVFGGLE